MKPTVYSIVQATPYRLAIAARPRGGDWLSDELQGLAQEGIEVLVSMLTEEESKELGLDKEREECDAARIRFINLPIPDRSVPANRHEFLQIVQELTAVVRNGRYIGVHCRAGIGRSSVLIASVLIQLGWKADAAFSAIESARGSSVPDTVSQRKWVMENIHTAR